MLARYMLSLRFRPSVCLSVRPSVASRSATKMAKPRITQTTPCDSPGTLFYNAKISARRNSDGITPNEGAKYRPSRLNWRLSTNISLYLRNGAGYGNS